MSSAMVTCSSIGLKLGHSLVKCTELIRLDDDKTRLLPSLHKSEWTTSLFVRELGTTRKVNGKCRFSRYASTEKQQHNSLVSAVLTLDDLELYKFEFSENFFWDFADFGGNNS